MGGVFGRVIYAMLLAGVLAAATWVSFTRFVAGKSLKVPNFTNLTAEEAATVAAERGLDGGLVGGQADLHFEHGVIGGFEGFLFGDLRGIDADGEGGERRILGVESEIGIERDAELLADPVHQGDIDGGFAG